MAKKKSETTETTTETTTGDLPIEEVEEFDLGALLDGDAPLLEVRAELLRRGYVEAASAADARGTWVRLVLHGGRGLELTRRDLDLRLEGVIQLDPEELRGIPKPPAGASPELLDEWRAEQDYSRARLEELTRPRVGRELLELLG